DATPVPVSVAESVTVAALTYQPARPAVPATEDVLRGSVSSTVAEPDATAGALPQPSVSRSDHAYVPFGTSVPAESRRSHVIVVQSDVAASVRTVSPAVLRIVSSAATASEARYRRAYGYVPSTVATEYGLSSVQI